MKQPLLPFSIILVLLFPVVAYNQINCGGEYEQLVSSAEANIQKQNFVMALNEIKAARHCNKAKEEKSRLDHLINQATLGIQAIEKREKELKVNLQTLETRIRTEQNILNKLESNIDNEILRREINTTKRGQEFSYANFLLLEDDLHFVQFGMYRSDVDLHTLKAPKTNGQAWLIYHVGTAIKNNKDGAYYLVQPYETPQKARTAVAKYQKSGISCWYNEALTKAKFLIKGITPYSN